MGTRRARIHFVLKEQIQDIVVIIITSAASPFSRHVADMCVLYPFHDF
jgi:hypothetical protein